MFLNFAGAQAIGLARRLVKYRTSVPSYTSIFASKMHCATRSSTFYCSMTICLYITYRSMQRKERWQSWELANFKHLVMLQCRNFAWWRVYKARAPKARPINCMKKYFVRLFLLLIPDKVSMEATRYDITYWEIVSIFTVGFERKDW